MLTTPKSFIESALSQNYSFNLNQIKTPLRQEIKNLITKMEDKNKQSRVNMKKS